MRLPELNETPDDDEMPRLVRRIFFLAALGSIGLAVLAAAMTRPGFEELMGMKHDQWGDRDRMVALIAGFPTALAGCFAAWQGFSGLPKIPSRIAASIGLLLNLTVLLGAGIPFLLDYLKKV